VLIILIVLMTNGWSKNVRSKVGLALSTSEVLIILRAVIVVVDNRYVGD